MTAQYLRPRDAARRFGVSKSTLARWAARGLIGKSVIDGCAYYAAGDIADLISRNEQPRTVVPIPQRRTDTAAAHAFFASARRAR